MKNLEDMSINEIKDLIISLEKTPWKNGSQLEEDRLRAIEMLKSRLNELE